MSKNALLVPLLALTLAGCAGITKDATYDNASKLREAVVSSGTKCPGDAVSHDDKFGEDFVKCSSELGLAVYDDSKQLGLRKALHDFSKETYLSGPNWIVQGKEDVLAAIKEKLGGTLTVG